MDSFARIFTPDIVAKMRMRMANSPDAEFRYKVVSLPQRSPDEEADWRNPDFVALELLREKQKKWRLWISAAWNTGFFQAPYGIDLRHRLTGKDDDGFRSALAECMACWAVSEDLRAMVRPRPNGRDSRLLELSAETESGEIHIEVKSPRIEDSNPVNRNVRANGAGAFDACRAVEPLSRALQSANKQFSEKCQNVLIFALPQLSNGPVGICCDNWPWPLIRSFYGDERLLTPPMGQPVGRFNPNGHFLKRFANVPRFTRTSAVLVLEDFGWYPKLQTLVLHNPYAKYPTAASTFRDWRQLLPVEGELRWSTQRLIRV